MENLKKELIASLKIYFDSETCNKSKKMKSGLLVQLKNGDIVKVYVKKVYGKNNMNSQSFETLKGMQNEYEFCRNKIELKDLKELYLYLNEIVNLEYDVNLNDVITVVNKKFKIFIK